ncbi:MAG TPA: hypothetical protein ENN03_04715 [bacterium]|nr:hypothetical protein [bacterium]
MMPIGKEVLDRAKAFLCWDVFEDLTIQLIEIQESVSFYYPPFQQGTIILYYQGGIRDFRIPLFHLFHEAGHVLQFKQWEQTGKAIRFYGTMDLPKGLKRTAFEKDASEKGRDLLIRFMEKRKQPHQLIAEYDAWSRSAAATYQCLEKGT